jgi:hypothetical protein
MGLCCNRGVALLLWFQTISTLQQYANSQSTYANVTLRSPDGDMSAVIFLPKGIKPKEYTYYLSSRFDHASMIGNIKRKTRDPETGKSTTHVLYGTEQWRLPHDPYWPESGVGLASEFGVGDDGALCNYRCGWYQANEVTNGVLGYQEAKNGESFLKIGVGELIKGSCPECDSTEDYKFNSPYEFAKTPVWTLEEDEDSNSIALVHEAVLNQYGYQLRKTIQLNNDELLVTTTLTNIGRIPFATAWYSHHFFTCDSRPVSKGVGADLDLAATGGDFEEPGTWTWASPIDSYASVTPQDNSVSVEMNRGVEQNVRIKAEFTKDEQTHGVFTLHGCRTSVKESIPEVGSEGGVSMYAYNLYIESGTFSPEPQIYMHLWPGQSISWTQRLEFDDYDEYIGASDMVGLVGAEIADGPKAASLWRQIDRSFMAFALTATCLALCIQVAWKRRRYGPDYSPIPDHEPSTGTNPVEVSRAEKLSYV